MALNEIMRNHVRSRCLFNACPRDSGAGFQHPWKTAAQRIDNQHWKITVNPGTVNDELALYIYLAQGDSRGWKMPANYVPVYSQPGTPNLVFRSPFDMDSQWNPPFLQVTAPDAQGKNLGDFSVTLGRPAYFSGNEAIGVSNIGRIGGATNQGGPDISDWPLYQCSIVLSAGPLPGMNNDLTRELAQLTTQLKKIIVATSATMPGIQDNVDAGTYLEISRLYLLRNPAAPITGDQIFVKQLHFWCLTAIAVQPSFNVGELQDATDYGSMIGAALAPLDGGLASMGLGIIGAIGDLELGSAQDLLDQAQSVSFCSC